MESSPPKWYMKHIALPSSLQPSLKWVGQDALTVISANKSSKINVVTCFTLNKVT